MNTRRILAAALTLALLLISAVPSALADKPVEFDSKGNEIGWTKTQPDHCARIQDGTIYASTEELLSTGYDEFGYNYQAHIFNGRYCDYDRVLGGDYCDVDLIMKWNDAWLANTDCDGDGELDRHYGYDSYIGSGAWLTNHQAGSYTIWDLVGDWVIDFDFGSHYVHDMTITDQTTESELVGTGGYPSGGPYTHPWTMTGSISGDTVSLEIVYGADAPNPDYTVRADGTIATDGSMSGTCTTSANQECTWVTTSGQAELVTCDWDYFTKIVAAPTDAELIDGIWYNSDGTEIGPAIWGSFATIQQVENDPCAGIEGVQYLSPDHAGFGGW